MESALILCGGTGAHTAVAFLRLHTLGYAFGFYDRGDKPFDLPTFYLVDQDSGDGREEQPTAWQLARNLANSHPGRLDWSRSIGRNQGPELIQCTPLPVGPNRDWYAKPYNTLDNRFESSEFLPLLTAEPQRQIDYSKGMMGSPAVGSLLFRLKHHDERGKGLNHDEVFGEMLETRGRIVVAGSGVGGTGASVGPTVASSLAREAPGNVMAVMILNWFEFDDQADDDEIRERAQRRNQLMRENANSALEFYGQRLARSVATVPVGMPSGSLLKRRFTGDVGQPIRESYIHAVAALSAYRHYLRDQPYRAGLYAMGAVEPGRLDGTTEIPGGTLQGLANQAATLASTLDVWSQVLSRPHAGRVRPALYDAVAATGADVGQVADHLREETEHYRQQLQWLEQTLGIGGRVNPHFTWEAHSRERLTVERKSLQVSGEAAPDAVAAALFHWTARWIRDDASKETQLEVTPGKPGGLQWPDLRNVEGLGVSAEINGDLNRISDNNRDAVLEAFVDPQAVSANGWPHPLAAADFFRRAIRVRDRVAQRQLELMLVGHMTGRFRLEPVADPGPEPPPVSLERLIVDARRDDEPHLAEYALIDTEDDRVVGFTSPHTLFAPVPFMNNDEDHRYWNRLWRDLSGADDGAAWNEAQTPSHWGDNDLAVRQICAWLAHQKQARPGNSPPWTRIFTEYPEHRDEVIPFGVGTLLRAYWGDPSDPDRKLVEINLPVPEVGEWTPPPGTPTLDETELFEEIPGLRRLTDEAGQVLFEMVELEMPERRRKLRGWWKDHLERLHKDGEIHIFSRDKKGAVILGIMRKGTLHATPLADSILLTTHEVRIDRYLPLEQDPVPGPSGTKVKVVRPDLPIKGQFLDLVATEDGSSVLQRLKEGETPGGGWLKKVGVDGQGREVTNWEIPVRGRRQPLPVKIPLEENQETSQAHWMVWPKFRSPGGELWKAYYVYSNTENRQVEMDVLWLEADWVTDQEGQPLEVRQRVRRRIGDEKESAYPIAYDKETKHHKGGPPLALILRSQQGEDQGVYLVPLVTLRGGGPQIAMAVDFGTSHSVAAVSVAGSAPEVVRFDGELGANATGLSVHISQNRAHVEKEAGVIGRGRWWPTYSDSPGEGFLPSELVLTRAEYNRSMAHGVPEWQPVRDLLIPRKDLSSKFAKSLLTDFKWSSKAKQPLIEQEEGLKEHYLALFLELALAEVAGNHLGAFPELADMTFTYPLRSTEHQVRKFLDTIGRALARTQDNTGIKLQKKGGEGIFDESRAAQLNTQGTGEVYVVADLGGGTLDLFIAAHGEFSQVADSARLGGNLLLDLMAAAPHKYLPGSWTENHGARLREWIRTNGMSSLFGREAYGGPGLFSKRGEAQAARDLIDKYFFLVIEYIARNTLSYLVEHWLPQANQDQRERLKIFVQLRGNGWGLWNDATEYREIAQQVQELVHQRVASLWESLESPPSLDVRAKTHWPEPARNYSSVHPKLASALNVVGQAMPYQDVKDRWSTHALVELEIAQGNGDRAKVDWHSKIPFKTGGSLEIEVSRLFPPILLSNTGDNHKIEVEELHAQGRRHVNRALQDEEYSYDRKADKYVAPVGPLVWEAVFDSDHFKSED